MSKHQLLLGWGASYDSRESAVGLTASYARWAAWMLSRGSFPRGWIHVFLSMVSSFPCIGSVSLAASTFLFVKVLCIRCHVMNILLFDDGTESFVEPSF